MQRTLYDIKIFDLYIHTPTSALAKGKFLSDKEVVIIRAADVRF